MQKIKVGINGFGRIGRAFTRIAQDTENIEVVHINTRKTTPEMMAYLLKYDSVYGKINKEVKAESQGISINNKSILTTNFADPKEIPWQEKEVDVVLDATGAFKDRAALSGHIKGTVRKVVLSAPTKDESIPTVVVGVNSDSIDYSQEQIFSNASCTTNCAAPLFKVLSKHFGIESALLTTVHAYTTTQSLLDEAGKTFDRSRAAGLNIIPSTTGAAKAVAKVIPELHGLLDAMSLRVPVPTGSFTDITAQLLKEVSVEQINQVFSEEASRGDFKNIMSYETDILVSSDVIGSKYSALFDSNYTIVINNKLVKICAWYDNEWGYSNRLADLIGLVL